MRSSDGAAASGPFSGGRTRLSVSAAAICAGEPVSTLTTPLGTSLVARTSARLMADSGSFSLATTTTVLPATSAGATADTSPSSEESWGAMIATTPVGSGTEMLKYGPE